MNKENVLPNSGDVVQSITGSWSSSCFVMMAVQTLHNRHQKAKSKSR